MVMPEKLAPRCMGPSSSAEGVTFRVWAPHAKDVSVIGTFNSWNRLANPMQTEQQGVWRAEVKGASIGDIQTVEASQDSLPFQASVSLASYRALIYSQ